MALQQLKAFCSSIINTHMMPAFIRDAGPPFDSGSDADVIVRSDDGVQFYLKKSLLASTAVAHLFTSDALLSDETIDGLPVVPFPQDGHTEVRGMLLYCMHGVYRDPNARTISRVHSLLEKYCVDPEGTVVMSCWDDYKPLPDCMMAQIERQTQQNADIRATAIDIVVGNDYLRSPIAIISSSLFDTIKTYGKDCRIASYAVSRQPHDHYQWISPATYPWFSRGGENHTSGCGRCRKAYFVDIYAKSAKVPWWWDYMEEVQRQPWGDIVRSRGGKALEKAIAEGSKCKKCRKDLTPSFEAFVKELARRIDEYVLMVKLEL